MAAGDNPIRYIHPDRLFDSIREFDPKYAVTRGEFTIDVPYSMEDMEWNHMDQMHRQHIHSTYQENVRIALGREFAVSLTRFGRWPFLITVTDMRVDRGLFYQDFVLGGVIFVHMIISMKESDGIIHHKLEWIIQSHRLLKFVHGMLSRKLHRLNARLQEEDGVIRRRRMELRKLGYSFRSDPPDYYNSNQLTNNTVYPLLPKDAAIALEQTPLNQVTVCKVGNVEFVVKRDESEVLIWPGACPHEGGELAKGELKDCRLQCPWHGLKFTAARLSAEQPQAQAYGFEYALKDNRIVIRQKA